MTLPQYSAYKLFINALSAASLAIKVNPEGKHFYINTTHYKEFTSKGCTVLHYICNLNGNNA